MPKVETTVKPMKIACLTVVTIALTVGLATAQYVEHDVVDGSSELTGAVPASNTFDEGFFWDFKSSYLSRGGFEDGTLHPYLAYPYWKNMDPAYIRVVEHAGRDSTVKFYWHKDTRDDHLELRSFSGARDELWWSFDLYVPEVDPENPDAPSFPDDHSTMISQVWHYGPRSDDRMLLAGLKINNNSLKVLNHGGPSINIAVEDIPRGEWNRVILQVIPSIAGNGTLRLWYGGEKVAEKSGIRVASSQAGPDDFTDDDRLIEEQRMKPWLGIYTHGGNDKRTLFFDNIISYAAKEKQSALRVEAENYDRYEDNTENNQGANDNQGGYRPDKSVDIASYWEGQSSFGYEESGYCVGWTEVGESLEYDIVVPKAGDYGFNFGVKSSDGSGKFKIEVVNEDGDVVYHNVMAAPDDWTTEGDTDGVQGNWCYLDENGNGEWDDGEDIWSDTGKWNKKYHSNETLVYYGGDGRDLLNGKLRADAETGKQANNLYFNDKNGNTEWDKGEDIWRGDANFTPGVDEKVFDGVRWTAVRLSPVFLEAGQYTVTLDVQESGCNLDWWEAERRQ